jgi:hypothetical protein
MREIVHHLINVFEDPLMHIIVHVGDPTICLYHVCKRPCFIPMALILINYSSLQTGSVNYYDTTDSYRSNIGAGV